MNMNKLLSVPIAVAIVLLLSAPMLTAQNYRNALSVNPLGLLFNRASVQYEMSLSGENSVAGRVNFLMREISGYDVSAFGLGGTYRWYLPPYRAIDGLWVGPSLDILFLKWKYVKEEISQTFFSVGGEVGYKYFFDQLFIEPNFGLVFTIGQAKTSSQVNPITLDYGDGIGYEFGLSLGYAW